MHSLTLKERITADIRANGPMLVEDYMRMCLYDPVAGYYTTGRNFPLEGPPVDFVTAPELTPLFGAVVARWVVGAWKDLGEPARWVLVEWGPGRGTLMRDILEWIDRVCPACAAGMEVVMVEVSPVLRERQKHLLAGYKNVRWEDDFLEGDGLPVVGIANEVMDAFPVRMESDKGPRYVEVDGEGAFSFSCNDGELAKESFIGLEEWVGRFVRACDRGLLMDYGGDRGADEVFKPTFQAMRLHAFCDPLAYPGESDLTAHVNFVEVRGWLGEERCAMMTLADFLLRHGVLEEGLGRPTELDGLQRLLHPAGMGVLFKVVDYTKAGKG